MARNNRLDIPRETRRTLSVSYDPETFGRLSERFARFLGTAGFLVFMTGFVLSWVLWNVLGPESLRFDDFPFIFLTLILSLQASYAAPIDRIGNKQIEKVLGQRQLPEFAPGDTIRVDVKVIEGTRERIQAFEGVCIARKSDGVNSSFTVRKISYGEGVERVFPTHAPQVAGVTVMRRGRVRRAKLYYLRGRTGKAARIAEKVTHREASSS